MRQQRWLAGLALLALSTAVRAAPPDPARALADTIDKHISAGWTTAKIKPAPQTDDAEFLRRVHLQIGGRIPSVAEVRAFLSDKRPDRRERVVNRLLESPRYVNHFVNVWRTWMMPEASASIQAQFLAPSFENWLRDKLRENVPYDKMVHELLTTPTGGPQGGYIGLPGGGAS